MSQSPSTALRTDLVLVHQPFLRAVLALLLGLMLLATVRPGALAQGTIPATLTIERNEICQHPGFPDTMRSIDTVPLILPAGNGPVTGTGLYNHTGTGYFLNGPSTYWGRVEGGGDLLVLTFGQWTWQGNPMTPAAPEMPTAGQPVEIEVRDGAERLIDFRDAHANLGVPCSGRVLYRLDLAP